MVQFLVFVSPVAPGLLLERNIYVLVIFCKRTLALKMDKKKDPCLLLDFSAVLQEKHNMFWKMKNIGCNISLNLEMQL